MDVIDKILKQMETKEGKEKVNKFLVKLQEQEKVENEQIKDILSNTSYMEWLIQFVQDKNSFFNDDWLYFPERLNDFDRENVDKLNLFYKGIYNYAKNKNILATTCLSGNFYKIKLNEIGLEIGILIGQGTVFFCKKVDLNDKQESIDFNDIINEQKMVLKLN